MDNLKMILGFVVGFIVVFAVIHYFRGRDKLAEFEQFRCPEGRFSVLLPGEPEKQIQPVNTAAGMINLVMYTAGSKKSGFAVAYAEYPQDLIAKSNPTEMLDGARDGAVANVNGRLLRESPLDFHGHPGREVDIEVTKNGQTGTVRVRLILVHNCLYQLMVITQSDEVLDNKGPEFFGSLTVDDI